MMERLESFFLPIADKLASNKYLTAIRDGFIAILPVMIIGSFFVMINNVIIGDNGLTNRLFNQPFTSLTALGGAIAPATMSIMSVLLTFNTAKALSSQYGDNHSTIPTIAVVNLIVLTPVVFDADLGIEYISTHYAGAASLFLAFVTALITVELVRKLSEVKALIIKMPDSVPPTIARSFNTLIPVTLSILLFGIVRLITNSIGMPLYDLMFEIIQTPFTNIVSSNIGLGVIYTLYMLL